MGHYIGYETYPCRTTEKSIMKNLNSFAFDPEESCSYHGNMHFHPEIVCGDYNEARKKIDSLDRGWYDDHAVMYKDGRKKFWLVKYEYHY